MNSTVPNRLDDIFHTLSFDHDLPALFQASLVILKHSLQNNYKILKKYFLGTQHA